VLIDGRSPAPRVVANLLLVLREAGAVGISAPICAACGKQLRTFHRRGEDWYCATCGPQPRPCASCGQDRIVATLDRQGRPRCSRCPEHDDRDPLLILTEVISTLDSDLTADVISAGIHRVFSKRGHLQHLAWAIEARPDLLTGQGAHAPMPAVLRLIDELCDAGAQTITRPACPRCQRIIRLHRRLDGQWHCRNCVAKSRAQPCSRCGAIREAAVRDEHGQPLCPNCLVTDPANHETCLGCGRSRRVHLRTPDGPLCPHLPAGRDHDLRDLRPLLARRDLQSHRRTVVPRLPAAASTLHPLRQRATHSWRDAHRPALRNLHPTRPVVLAHLPRLRRNPPRTAAAGAAHAAHCNNDCSGCCAVTPARSTRSCRHCTTTSPTTTGPTPCCPG